MDADEKLAERVEMAMMEIRAHDPYAGGTPQEAMRFLEAVRTAVVDEMCALAETTDALLPIHVTR